MNTDYGCQCDKAELDLFSAPPVNTSMEKGHTVVHHPIASLTDNGPIEFHIPSSPDEYIDLARTMLYVKCRVVNSNGTPFGDSKDYAPVNLLLHSLFSQVDVKLRDTLVTPSVNTYAYKSYLETLLSYGSDAKDSHLTSELWYQDTGAMDCHKLEGTTNTGYASRHAASDKSSLIELFGRPHADIFQQDRYLLSGVDMHLRFIRSSTAFHMMVDTEDVKVAIVAATLHARKVSVNPALALAHAKLLDSGKFAKYPLRRGVVSTFTVPSGSYTFNKENVITGQLPRRIVLAFVSNSAFNGNPKQNPYNFKHFNLNFLSLHNGSQVIPSQPLTPNYAAGEYLQAYNTLQQGMGFSHTERGVAIDRDDFKKGFAIYAFDLTPDQVEGDHVDVVNYGNLRIEVHFNTAPTVPLNCIVYSEFDNLIQIDRSRNIITDFPAS